MSGLSNVRLATENDDDLYSGFNDYNPIFDTKNIEEDEGYVKALQTSHGKRPPMTALRTSGIGKPIGTSAGFRWNMIVLLCFIFVIVYVVLCNESQFWTLYRY